MFEVGDLVVANPAITQQELERIGVEKDTHTSWFYDNHVMRVKAIYDFTEIMVVPVGRDHDQVSVDDYMLLPIDRIRKDFIEMKEELGV